MSQTTGDQCPAPSVTFNQDGYSAVAHYIQQTFVQFGLLGGLYGVLTVLSLLSVLALTQRGTRRTQPTAIILCLTILTLFTSTTIYAVTYTLSSQSAILKDYILSGFSLWYSNVPPYYPIDATLGLVKDYSRLQNCAGTAALTINITLGDAIVCWRACTIWHKNHVVRLVCGVFLIATFVLGVIDTTGTCQPADGAPILEQYGPMYEGIPIGIATCVLSLSTNLLATLLVGYKAWESRRRLRGYLVAGGSQVEKLFALLVESGAVYCAIWGAVVAYQITGTFNTTEYDRSALVAHQTTGTLVFSNGTASFRDVFGVLFNGALVPVVAIYPTIIIVLVALNRSHMEKGLSRHLSSLPTPHISFAVNTTMTSESTPHRMSEVLVIDSDRHGAGCGDGVEDASTRTSKEWKADPLV